MTQFPWKRPVIPEAVRERREALRQRALKEGFRALKAIEDAGGKAVLFGSVIKPGAFREGSDIDLCLLEPSTYSLENSRFFTVAELAVSGFDVDVSWFDDLIPEIRAVVEKEGKGVADLV